MREFFDMGLRNLAIVVLAMLSAHDVVAQSWANSPNPPVPAPIEIDSGITLGDSADALSLENQALRERIDLLDAQQQATMQSLDEMREQVERMGIIERYQDGIVICQTPDDARVPLLMRFNLKK